MDATPVMAQTALAPMLPSKPAALLFEDGTNGHRSGATNDAGRSASMLAPPITLPIGSAGEAPLAVVPAVLLACLHHQCIPKPWRIHAGALMEATPLHWTSLFNAHLR